MRFENVNILSVEHVDAPHVLSSAEIEKRLALAIRRLGVRPNLLQELSGISERRLWDPGTTPSEPAAWAGEKAIEASGIDRSQIGALVNTSVSRDYLEPSTGCAVHHGLSPSNWASFWQASRIIWPASTSALRVATRVSACSSRA